MCGLRSVSFMVNLEIHIMTLDKRLAYLRKRERMSQAEVAERLDVSRQAVSRWESGDSKPSIENLQSLCKLYHKQIKKV